MENTEQHPIPFRDLGGSGAPLVFLHANGYPPGCYSLMLQDLSDTFHVQAPIQRPLWPGSRPESIQDWLPLSQDLLRYLDENHTQPVVAVGHSMGGIAVLRAALSAPQRFRALVLIDPVLFPPYFIFAWRFFRALGLGHQVHPLIRTAKTRRRRFDDLNRLFNGYRRRATFKYMSDEALRDYIQAIACPTEDGAYRLCYPVEWEVHIYDTGVWRDMDLWRGLPNLRVPLLIIRGGQTDTFLASTARRVARIQPQARIVTIARATHLVPLEHPRETSQLIKDFLKEMV